MPLVYKKFKGASKNYPFAVWAGLLPEQNLDNDDSKAKAKIGQQWDMLAGSKFRYFMVFQSKAPDFPGAYSYDQFMEIAKEI